MILIHKHVSLVVGVIYIVFTPTTIYMCVYVIRKSFSLSNYLIQVIQYSMECAIASLCDIQPHFYHNKLLIVTYISYRSLHNQKWHTGHLLLHLPRDCLS